jgi:hypothetical protein
VTDPTSTSGEQVLEPAQPYPNRVLIEAHGIDVRIEGKEPTAELGQLAIATFERIQQLRPQATPVGFHAGALGQAERAEPLAYPLDSPTLSPAHHLTKGQQ